MKVTAQTFQVIAAETVLIPPVLHSFNVAGEYQKKRRQRSELIDPVPLLDPHPVFEFLRVLSLAPFQQIDHHNSSVEVTRVASLKRRRIGRVRPEPVREVVGEVSVTILWCSENARAEIDLPELRDVVDDDEIGVEVDDSSDGGREEIGEVDPGVVERLVEGAADGIGDLSADEVGVEVVEAEGEGGERGCDDAAELVAAVSCGDEVEDDVLWTGCVLKDGEHAGDGAAEVGCVQRHRDVDDGRVVRSLVSGGGGGGP